MQEKGFVKSTTPDVLVSIVTKAERNVNVYQNNVGFGYGWGWYNPFWFGGGFNNFGTFETVEGRLFIDIIDANKKELIWQGVGTAALVEGPEAKDERIQEIVSAILAKYQAEAEDIDKTFQPADASDYRALADVEFASFLNGLIVFKRGAKDGPAPVPEVSLSNNAAQTEGSLSEALIACR